MKRFINLAGSGPRKGSGFQLLQGRFTFGQIFPGKTIALAFEPRP
jgi:hypothetical protein